MPKKNSIINNTIPEEKILIKDEIPEVKTPQIIANLNAKYQMLKENI